MFLVDIQQDQAADMKAFLAERLPRESQPLLIPVLRARVTGKGMNLDEVEDLQGRGRLSREYTITYRGQLESNETLLEGRFPKAIARIRSARGVDRRGCRRALRHRRRRRHALRRDGPRDPRSRQRHPPRRVARRAQRRIHVRVWRRHVRGGAALVFRAGPGEPRGRSAAGKIHARSGDAVPQCVGHRPARTPGIGPKGVPGGDGCDRRRRHPRDSDRRTDPCRALLRSRSSSVSTKRPFSRRWERAPGRLPRC